MTSKFPATVNAGTVAPLKSTVPVNVVSFEIVWVPAVLVLTTVLSTSKLYVLPASLYDLFNPSSAVTKVSILSSTRSSV